MPIAAPAARVLAAALAALLEAERQPFISDPSNLDPAFERSRFRDGGNAIAEPG